MIETEFFNQSDGVMDVLKCFIQMVIHSKEYRQAFIMDFFKFILHLIQLCLSFCDVLLVSFLHRQINYFGQSSWPLGKESCVSLLPFLKVAQDTVGLRLY